VKCLSCRRKMAERVEETSRGPIHYDVCKTCGGMWFDAGEMDAMVLQVFDSVELSSRDKLKDVSEPLRRCPRCKGQWLDKVFFMAHTQILLDYCANCHGFWLDGGEFKRINKELQELKELRDEGDMGPIGRFIMALVCCILHTSP